MGAAGVRKDSPWVGNSARPHASAPMAALVASTLTAVGSIQLSAKVLCEGKGVVWVGQFFDMALAPARPPPD
jgi:hypothetical protein